MVWRDVFKAKITAKGLGVPTPVGVRVHPALIDVRPHLPLFDRNPTVRGDVYRDMNFCCQFQVSCSAGGTYNSL